MHRFLSALAVLVAVLWSTSARAQEPVEVLLDDWSVVSISGGEVGYSHTRTERRGSGDTATFHTTLATRMRIKRLGAEIVIESDQTHVEAASGAPLTIESRTRMSTQETHTAVRFEGGKAFVTKTVMDQSRETVLDVPADLVGPAALVRLTKARLDEVGAAFELSSWSADVDRHVAMRIVVMAAEDVAGPDGVERLRRYDTTAEVMGPVVTSSWVDANGDVVRTSATVMGMKMESRRTTAEQARAAYEAGSALSPDVFAASLIAADAFLPRPRAADRALLLITPRRAGVELGELADARQRVLGTRDDGALELEVTRRAPPAGRTGVRPLVDAPAELAETLGASSMIQSDHELIVRTAAEIVGEERDAWRAAQAIERWVEANVTDKSLDVAFASALEVCTNRSGDCSEHAVLLCALARASGIPSRVAMGLLYLGGIWGGHAWTEVWIDGEWYALDGTLGHGSVDALHLTVARMALADGSPANEFANLARVMGEIDVDVLSMTFGERVVDLAGGPSVRIDGRRFVDPGWGLAFEAPEGFEIELNTPRRAIEFELLEIEGRTASGRMQIEVSSFDEPARIEWKDYMGRVTGELESLAVDGRPARSTTRVDGRRTRRVVAVDSDGVLFVFEFDDVGAEANAAAAEAFLASLDFDLAEVR
jgi:transglutaminase-like putative cysteine protease